MKNKLIFKILAFLAAGVSVFSLAGCANNGGKPNAGGEPPIADDDNPVIGGEDDDGKKDDDEGGGEIVNNPVKGAVEIIKFKGDLEAAYVTWKIGEGAKWYNVYVKASSDAAYSTKLDDQLVRKYSTYFRADAVGLAAGSYDFKVVPVDATTNSEATEYASEAKNISVESHIRVGYAFVGGTSSGAYNEDGTLKSNARVIYVTEKSKNTVSLEVTGAAVNPCVGLKAIFDGYSKGKESRSLAVRLVGNVTDLEEMDKGDIVISNKTDKNYAGSGITFEGIGNDATVNGWGVRVKDARNIEIRNLGFMNCDSNEGDNVGLQQDNDHVWVHNCDMFYGNAGSDADQIKGDGALDTKNTTNVTHSFNHFWDSGKCNLQGMKGETTDNCVTYHHNWYDHSDSRHPRIRTCTVHVFNNYFDGNAKYGVGVTYGASAFVENNYFRSTATMKPMLISEQGTDAEGDGTFSGEDGGVIKSFGNKFDVPSGKLKLKVCTKETIKNVNLADFKFDYDCYETESRDEQVPGVKAVKGGTTYSNFDTASNMYEYEVETPEDAKATVQKYAGRIDGGDLQHQFNNAADDSSYAVIPALKERVTNYKSDLLDVGGVYVGGGDVGSGGGNGSTGDGDTVVPVEGAIVCSFVNGKSSHEAIKVSGGAKNTSLKINAINQTFASGLKFESATYVKFTLTEEMTITLYFDGSAGQRVRVDGTQVATQDVGGDKVITMTLKAGEHELTKGDSINLYYLVLTPKS